MLQRQHGKCCLFVFFFMLIWTFNKQRHVYQKSGKWGCQLFTFLLHFFLIGWQVWTAVLTITLKNTQTIVVHAECGFASSAGIIQIMQPCWTWIIMHPYSMTMFASEWHADKTFWPFPFNPGQGDSMLSTKKLKFWFIRWQIFTLSTRHLNELKLR